MKYYNITFAIINIVLAAIFISGCTANQGETPKVLIPTSSPTATLTPLSTVSPIVTTNTVNPGKYAGMAKIVLQIENYSEGRYYIKVLSSNDLNIAEGDNCWLSLGQPMKGISMVVPVTPAILTPGVIIGVNDYRFSNIDKEPGQIWVEIPENTMWTNKVKLLNVENASVQSLDAMRH